MYGRYLVPYCTHIPYPCTHDQCTVDLIQIPGCTSLCLSRDSDLGKTNMFRYNDPLEAADLRKNMSEKSRKASLMNQSLMSQSLSDLRHPPGCRNSGEWRMFSSDSDIKDIIAEGEVLGGGEEEEEQAAGGGSRESINTLKNPSAQVNHSLPIYGNRYVVTLNLSLNHHNNFCVSLLSPLFFSVHLKLLPT